MTNTIRKRLGPLSVVATIAAIGILAAFIALAAMPDSASAQAPPQPPAPPGQDGGNGGLPPPPPPPATAEPTGEPNESPVGAAGVLSDVELHISTTSNPIDVADAFSDPDGDTLTYRATSGDADVANATIVGSVMTIVAGGTRGTATITVTASDGKGGTGSVTLTVTVIEVYSLFAVPPGDPMLPAAPAAPAEDPYAKLRSMGPNTIFVVEEIGAYSAKFSLAVDGSEDDVTVTVTASPEVDVTIVDSDGLIGAGFNEERDLEGSLTVKATDAGSRAFEIEGECQAPGGFAIIEVEDKDLEWVAGGAIYCKQPAITYPGPDEDRSDTYTVASYSDWEFSDVTDGFIITDAKGVDHMVNDHHNVRGWLDRDEPVVRSYQLGVSDVETLTQRTDPQAGQRTVEALVGIPNIQLTVTAIEEGPAYIRFLDSNMQPFGTDVDEEPMYRGADVVGLDSQGRLVLNREVALSNAQALAFDQYRATVPGNPDQSAFLTGLGGQYHQGAFRIFNPCPQVDHSFYVQVYEKSGKYLKTTEKVTCIAPPRVVPSALSVTTFSDIPGRARLEWVEAIGATAHWVIVIEQASGQVVPGSLQQIPAPDTAAEISGLRENVDYVFAVAAERRDSSGAISYSAPSHIVQAMQWD